MIERRLPTDDEELRLHEAGYRLVAGLDEAGRGALAGPVVAAAVILPRRVRIDGVRDSKLVPEGERELLCQSIIDQALAWGVGLVDNRVIDHINILQATFQAMRQAVAALSITPDFVLIDGRDAVDVGSPCRALVGGDRTSRAIAAASIIAKVARDKFMRDLHHEYPLYTFNRNKGYGTPRHRQAIQAYGPSPVHRVSFLGRVMQLRLL